MAINLDALEENLGIKFKNFDLYNEALTHRSYLNERPKWHYNHNERLEYLGDAVLELVVTDELFREFPESPEGQLTVLRAALVNREILAKVATEVHLEKFILMSRGELRDSGKAKDAILSNAFEAIVGAIYLDVGIDLVRSLVKRVVMPHLAEILKSGSYRDAKSELQEYVQEKLKVTPTYKVLGESGPAHKRTFNVGVYFGEKLIAEGSGESKQEAETEAAKNALKAYK